MADYEQYEDIQLIALIREQKSLSNRAFKVIYDRYNDRLFTYCYYKADTYDDAKDLCQETWLKFIEHVKTGVKGIYLPAVLFRIALNLRINDKKSAKNRMQVSTDDFEFEKVADSLNLQDIIEKKELVSVINLAISTLSETNKNTFILKWLSGLSYAQIAEVTGESIDCIRQRSSRAMNELLKILKPIMDEFK